MDLFSVFNDATHRTAKQPIPTLTKKRSQEIKDENITLLRTKVLKQEKISIQTEYETPKNHAFPNSRIGEEKDNRIAEGDAAANPDSQARHPSPPTPSSADGEVDISTVFNYSRA